MRDPNEPRPNHESHSNPPDDGKEHARDETVHIDPEKSFSDTRNDIVDDHVPISGGDKTSSRPADPSAGTVGKEDPTVAIQDDSSNSGKEDPPSHDPDLQETLVSDDASDRVAKGSPGSVLSSQHVDRTINPRELSPKDLALWAAAVGSRSNEATSVVEPAIERTFSDRQFDRLRRCNVHDPKSDKVQGSPNDSPDLEVSENPDYELKQLLGQGGMGDVYRARQYSLDRILALKLIKPLSGRRRAKLIRTGRLATVETERRRQFLSEAIVTGDLDHPNIVPIHDVALTDQGELFYSMKLVTGTPWSKTIHDNSQEQNLEILLKVADAIGFAHTRGVVHRDIKPENIMLGDFGVVMVMDWGLALPTSVYEKHDSIFRTSGLGGTPAFMAPELASGPIDRIGPASDIYLLGATLFYIITGVAPHEGKNVTECLAKVRSNTIRPVAEEHRGELMDIALRAMATDPADRFASVIEFQEAIRSYRSHVESIALSDHAADDLAKGQAERSYRLLSRAAFGFQEALQLWSANERARQGLAQTRIVHAEAALENGDFDLGKSLLDSDDPAHLPILDRLDRGLRERQSRLNRLRTLKATAAALLAIIIGGGAIAGMQIKRQRDLEKAAKERAIAAEARTREALRAETRAVEQERQAKLQTQLALKAAEDAKTLEERARKDAEQQRSLAEDRQRIAEQAQRAAQQAREQAEMARDLETESRRQAELANQLAEANGKRAAYEAFVSQIALAKERLDRNEADGAREILRRLAEDHAGVDQNWEWRWLWNQSNRFESTQQTQSPVVDWSLDRPSRRGAAALRDGSVCLVHFSGDGTIQRAQQFTLPRRGHATAVAIAPKGNRVAVGTRSGNLLILERAGHTSDSADGTTFDFVPSIINAHHGAVNDLVYAWDDVLFSASEDRTVRVWNPHTGQQVTGMRPCWHLFPVKQIAVGGPRDSITLAAVNTNDRTGQVAVWTVSLTGSTGSVSPKGTFLRHGVPVSAVAIRCDGGLAASGDVEGNLYQWDPAQVAMIDYDSAVDRALSATSRHASANQLIAAQSDSDTTIAPRPSALERADIRFDKPESDEGDVFHVRAHDDEIQTICFSEDGRELLTGSDDTTLKLWHLTSNVPTVTMKGHGSWVVGADFGTDADSLVISASNDATIRSWKPHRYVGSSVVANATDAQLDPDFERQLHQDPIWSARFSRDGSRVVTASHDHTARIARIDPSTLTFRDPISLSDSVLDEGTSYLAMSMQIDHRHGVLYVGSADGAIRMWDLALGTQINEISGTGFNTLFDLSGDGKRLLTGSSRDDEDAIVWDVDPDNPSGPQRLLALAGHHQPITALALSRDGKWIFTADRGGFGLLWDAESGQRVGDPIEAVRDAKIHAAMFSHDNRWLLIASDNETVSIVDLASRDVLTTLVHDAPVIELDDSPGGQFVVTVSELATQSNLQTTATLWDLKSGKSFVLDDVVIGHAEDRDPSDSASRGRITSARFAHDGKTIVVAYAAAGNDEPALLIQWPLNVLTEAFTQPAKPVDSKKLGRRYRLPGSLGTSETVIPIDETQVVTMNKNGAFRWDLVTSELRKSYRAHAELTESSFSFDDAFVATASRSVKIWDASSGKPLFKLESSRPIRSVQFAPIPIGPTKYAFATAGDDGIARLWQWDAGKRAVDAISKIDPAAMGLEHRIVRRVRFSPDGQRLLVVGDQGLAVVVDRDQPAAMMPFSLPPSVDGVSGVFSPSGRSIAIGGSDHLVRIWDVPNARVSPQSPRLLRGHADAVTSIAWLAAEPGRQRIMTGSADGTIRIWDPPSANDAVVVNDAVDAKLGGDANDRDRYGRELLSLRRHHGAVTAVDLTADGDLLMSAGHDGVVVLWPAK